MATRAIMHGLRKSQSLTLLSQSTTRVMPMRFMHLSTETGAIAKKPDAESFGLFKVILISIPFIYAGAVTSREGAAWLEENEIFSPEDDD